MRLRYLAGYGAYILALCHKLRSFWTKDNSGYVRVLMYHNIHESKLGLFERQIRYLASNYRFLTPEQFQRFVQGEYRVSGVNLFITFDDGFKSNRIVAEKVLNPLGIKGIFFIPTEFIGILDKNKQREFIAQKIYDGDVTNTEISSDMKPLTWEDLEYLLSQGHVIGSHTLNHRRLSILNSPNIIHDEIIESGNILEKKLGVPVTHFAYPFGDIDSISSCSMDLVKERYEYCFSGIRGANCYPVLPYAILRDSIAVGDPPRYVRLIVENGIDIFYRRKAAKLLTLAGGGTF